LWCLRYPSLPVIVVLEKRSFSIDSKDECSFCNIGISDLSKGPPYAVGILVLGSIIDATFSSVEDLPSEMAESLFYRRNDSHRMIKIAPSILSADFSRLGEEVRRLGPMGADWVHVDVMDGNFVPNITIGPGVVKAIRQYSDLPFDVHLMILRPEEYLERFAEAGADFITIHVEACQGVGETLQIIRDLGKRPGLSLNPSTPFSEVAPFMDNLDLLLIMTVNPGFGGQSFMHEVVPKIREAREHVDENGLDMEIAIDGGINAETGKIAVEAGATVLDAGSSLFGAEDMAAEMAKWKLF